MYYRIKHITRYRYVNPIQENVMEARLKPRTEGNQRCLEFELAITPRTQVAAYQDYLGNTVHHFNIPGAHMQLRLVSTSIVDVNPPPAPPESLPLAAWDALDNLPPDSEIWDMRATSQFTRPTPLLRELMAELEIDTERRQDPLTTLRTLNQKIYNTFAYAPQTTRVDSPINEAITARQGVCQDFTHIMLAIARQLDIPCRYVSGYLYHREESGDRSAEDATHAWVEAYLPDLCWVGFDPTNNLVTGERHIRVAIGQDYADVPPTKGVYRGNEIDELHVGVQVSLADAPQEDDEMLTAGSSWIDDWQTEENDEDKKWQEQQQQQQ